MSNSWLLPNRAGFNDFIKKRFFDLYNKESFPQQQFVQDYLQYDSPYRGLLLYHGLGTGKTKTALNVIENLKDYKEIIVFTKASIQSTFIQQVLKHSQKGFNKEQYWTSETIDKLYVNKTLKTTYEKTIKKHKRIWYGNQTKSSNFNELDDKARKEIEEQLIANIKDNFNITNYNGINSQKQVNELRNFFHEKGNETAFDNKLIIIDEAHDFARPVANGSPYKTQIYNDFMKANNATFVLMTGTPITNDPFEFSVLINLIYGHMKIHSINLHPTRNENIYDILDDIQNDPNIDILQHHINDNYKEEAICILTPEGFTKEAPNGYVIRSETYNSTADILKRIRNKMEHANIIKKQTPWNKPYKETLFPAFNYEFSDMFVDTNGFLKNENIFMRRLLGKISYFKRDDESIAFGTPQQYPLEKTYITMSDTQLQQYRDTRHEEITRLKRQAKRGYETQDFRSQSLAVCNFVYPSEAIEKDNNNGKSYSNPDLISTDALKLDALTEYSPKYKNIVERITENKGLDLVYSFFRNKVGIELLSRILDINGWTRVREVKDKTGARTLSYESSNKPKYIIYDQDDEDEFEILKTIYNNELDDLEDNLRKQCEIMKQNPASDDKGNEHGNMIKVLFITQKGSAGLNLRNVRRVHISEPPWVETNIQQIIGRAIRTESHSDLPKNEQNVKPYIYLSVAGEEKSFDATVRERDGNKTSDEIVYEKAKLKEEAIQSFLNAIRRSAVDCPLYGDSDCYDAPINVKSSDLLVEPFFEDEKKHITQTKQSDIYTVGIHFQKGKNPTYYLYEPYYSTLYDYNSYKQFGTFESVGSLQYDDKDKKYYVYI